MFHHAHRSLRGPTLSGDQRPHTPVDREPLALTRWDRARLWLHSQAADETLDRAVAGTLAAVCLAAAVVLLLGWTGASHGPSTPQQAHATTAAAAPGPALDTPAAAPPTGGGSGTSSAGIGGPVDLDPCDDPLDRVLRNTGRFAFKSWSPTERCETPERR